jgi:hypothetical protein
MQIINEIIELQLPKIRLNANIVMFAQWLLSTSVFLGLFLAYQKYASENGIQFEKGCCGPELPFGMLTGFLFLLKLRYSVSLQERKLPFKT